jgi:hypothetical protein
MGFVLCARPPTGVEPLALAVPPCVVSGGNGAFFTLVRRRKEVEKSLKRPTSAPSPTQVKWRAEIPLFLPRPEGVLRGFLCSWSVSRRSCQLFEKRKRPPRKMAWGAVASDSSTTYRMCGLYVGLFAYGGAASAKRNSVSFQIHRRYGPLGRCGGSVETQVTSDLLALVGAEL